MCRLAPWAARKWCRGYLQQHGGMRAGKVHIPIDCAAVLLALFIVPIERVAYSVLGVVVMSGFLWVRHRSAR